MAASDADTGENSRVSFLRAKFDVRDLFNIKEERGVITGVNTNIYYNIDHLSGQQRTSST